MSLDDGNKKCPIGVGIYGLKVFIFVSDILTSVSKMLTRLFTSKARIKILKVLLFSGRSFHLRELSREAKVSPPYASEELSNLQKAGIVQEEKRANLRIYSIKDDCPILPELKSLFIKTDYFGESVKKALSGKARYALIYGSFARRDEREGSDIDLLVVSEIKEDELLKLVLRLQKGTGREVNYILWNDDAFRKKKGIPLLKTILSDGFIMLIGDEKGFRKEAG
jgi:predicted nucleotidyltransferase/predicted DNA-binding transcriptional regulator